MSGSFLKNNLRHIFLVTNNSQGYENTKLPSVLSTFQQSYDIKLFQFHLLHLEKFIFTEHTEMPVGQTSSSKYRSMTYYHYPFILRRKSINMLTSNSLQKRTFFLRTPPSGCLLQENTCVGVSFSEYCEIFKSTYFKEHLQTTGSENVFKKLRKIRIYP